MEKVSGTSYLREIIETQTVPPAPLHEKEQLTRCASSYKCLFV